MPVSSAYTIDALVPMDNQEMVVKVLSYLERGTLTSLLWWRAACRKGKTNVW